MNHCTSSSCSVVNAGEYAAGARIRSCKNVVCDNMIFNGNNAQNTEAFGLLLDSCDSVTVTNSIVKSNVSFNELGIGFSAVDVKTFSLNNCEASNNSYSGVLVDNSNVVVKYSNLLSNGLYGVKDNVGVPTNIYLENVAVGNLTDNLSIGGATSVGNIVV